ncbi:MAG: VWA domain-containing protein [Candidatus Tectomicrobia bacterium]|uniref:VWA domain-containing protein n=1 Tax=Tectimicrobiota bacterium TaxID=2528274 RepID=A0A933GK70_UNCTE|nr:VWA domain-containing protein [Candidatus Tectomicrobia bacterium]
MKHQEEGLLTSRAFRFIIIFVFIFGGALFFLFGRKFVGAPVKIVMWSSGEKMNYLKDIVFLFNKEKHTASELFKDGNKQPIIIEAYTVNSGPMSEHLVNKIRDGLEFPPEITSPHLVSPSVDHWLSRVNFLTKTQVFDLDKTKPLALTPVVIAMFEDMARALGWPAKPLGWADIIALAQDPQGWMRVSQAKIEWGKKPLLAWTDPFVSSTARSALFAAYVAAAKKPAEQLTINDIDRPEVQQNLKRLQGVVDHYFPETLKLQTKIFQGPKFVHFAPLEEYMLPWMKLGLVNSETVVGKEEKKPLEKRMVAIYPREGTIWHNNPGAILQNVPWTDKAHQQAAHLFVEYLLKPENQLKAMEWGFRPANPQVPFGKYLSKEYGIDPQEPRALLGRINPEVAEAIMNRWQDVKKPGIIALVIDLSGSMQGAKLAQAKEGAKRFLEAVAPHNMIGLVTFSDHISNVIPIASTNENKYFIADVIDRSSASGKTSLYDAIKVAINMVDKIDFQEEAIRGIVLLTDGMRTSGQVKLSDIVTLMTREEKWVSQFDGGGEENKKDLLGTKLAITTKYPIHIFSIALGADADIEVLRILAEATNSTFNKATEKDLAQILERFGKYF